MFLLMIIVCSLHGCDNFLLHSYGSIATKEHRLILISFVMMLFIIVPVIFMTIYFAYRYHQSNVNQIYRPNWSHSYKIEIAIWTMPILIISCLAFLSWYYSHELEPKKPISSYYDPVKIDVVALNWRWLFIYPDYHIATINEIMFPVNRPVIFRITSDTVMNSFFIPFLGSQIYAMPGMQTKLNLIANYPGKYTGMSSNYSGPGFSNMKFKVTSVSKNTEFGQWIKNIQNSFNELNTRDALNKVLIKNENFSIEYFSNVNVCLFNQIIYRSLVNNYSINKNNYFKQH
jgi:cytochrome o ubiquinol oxidase subunit 2